MTGKRPKKNQNPKKELKDDPNGTIRLLSAPNGLTSVDLALNFHLWLLSEPGPCFAGVDSIPNYEQTRYLLRRLLSALFSPF